MRVLNYGLYRFGTVLCIACLVVLITACNDKPTDIALDLTPGTDTLYASSSLDSGIGLTATASSTQYPILNSTYTLFGKTTDSEARLIIEFINYPKLGNAADYEVLSSDLQLFPQTYRFGDTNNRTLGIAAYELKREWAVSATWDSIWDADGNTTYYSTADPSVCTFNQPIAATDSIVNVPFALDATKRWLTLGADSTTAKDVFGLAVLPTETGAVWQFRNLNSNEQIMRLRVVYKHKDSTANDTVYINSAASVFVNTPAPAADDILTQGARVLTTTFDVDLTSLPSNAMLLGAKFTITTDKANSSVSTFGLDQVLALKFTPSDGSGTVEYQARVNDAGTYQFVDLSYALQSIIRTGGKGTLVLSPFDNYLYWQMNRVRINNMASDSSLRPRMSVVYTVPLLLQ